MSYQRISGLGVLQYNTGRGVFRPGGNGGGIFDGNIAGLGSTARRRPVSGLGAVPASCWDVPGFKDCHNVQFAAAQKFCGSQTAEWLKARGYADLDTCIKETDSAYTDLNCVSKYCGGGTPAVVDTGSKYPWGTYSSDTLALQQQTNKALKEAGYCPVGEDGKLGKGTCGAVRKLLGQAPSTCQDFKEPSKPPCPSAAISYAAPSSPQALSPAQQAALTAQYGGGTNWTKYLMFAGGAAAVLGIAYYLDKKRSH